MGGKEGGVGGKEGGVGETNWKLLNILTAIKAQDILPMYTHQCYKNTLLSILQIA